VPATLAVSLSVLALALLGPAQTLAQTHKGACSTSTHAGKRGAHACTEPSRKLKTEARHATKRRAKHTSKKSADKSAPASQAPVAARCEDGSTPVRADDGAFSCDDGSEPACEDGATPALSRDGKSLLCPAPAESEAVPGEAECEEQSGCATTGSDSGEQACAASAAGSSSSGCEAED
jgi:hypothetical protein